MKVLKFGGTSLGSPALMKSIVDLINQEEPQIIVLSAISGTTNQLVEINSFLMNDQIDLALKEVNHLESKYKSYISELLNTKERRVLANTYIEKSLNLIRRFATHIITKKEERIILAQGELCSSFFFNLFVEEIGLEFVLLSALDFMFIDEYKEPNLMKIRDRLLQRIDLKKQTKIFITQGYICRNHLGEIDNLQRGGSDYSASLIGAALEVNEIQIWTDIDGMQNNDPRYVSPTKSIANLSFDEAAELAYFGAKILHPTSILPAKKANIPVRLKNTLCPNSEGTLISNVTNNENIKAIAAKDGIVAIQIKSDRMLMAYGFLKRTFEVFEKYKTPVDTVTTSEVGVSLTIDDDAYISEITTDLSEMASFEVHKDLSIICVVGDFLADKPGTLEQIFKALIKIPIRMVSYGGSKNNVSLLVKTSDKRGALIALNEGLFNLRESFAEQEL